MSVLDRLAVRQGRRDEVPNQELARDLAAREDTSSIREIAENLWNADPAIQSNCIKVLAEIGNLRPDLIAPYTPDFLRLLSNRQNRLIWGGMMALSSVAPLRPKEIYNHLPSVIQAMERGSVITIDNGVKVLAHVAAARPAYHKQIWPYLLRHLRICRPKEVPQHAESTLPAANARNKAEFIAVLKERLPALSSPQAARVNKILRNLDS